MFTPPKNTFRVAAEYQPVLRAAGLDAAGVFRDPRVVCWRKLVDRENCTLDINLRDGQRFRLHIKRYPPTRGSIGPADDEVKGHHSLVHEKIPTAPLVGWGKLADRRSFTIWQDLAGYTPADKLVAAGTPFDRLLEPTADLAARLHRAGLHHRDLYLCHFMARIAPPARGVGEIDLKLIDTARVRRLGGFLTRRRWIVKDLAQFWYSTLSLRVTDIQRTAWLERYARQRGDGTTAAGLRGSIERKVAWIGQHDRKLREAQPTRNISIPTPGTPGPPAAALAPRVERTVDPSAAFHIRAATPADAEAVIAHVHRIADEPGIMIPMAPGEFEMTVEQERKYLAETAAAENSVYFVAEAEGEIIAALNCTGRKRKAMRHVATIGVSVRQEWRGRGVGTALLQRAIEWAHGTGVVTRLELEVYACNAKAIGLYERFGFVHEGRRQKAVVHNGRYEDDVVMALLL